MLLGTPTRPTSRSMLLGIRKRYLQDLAPFVVSGTYRTSPHSW